MKALLDWLDHRTGYRGLLKGALYEHIPGGARWRYVWGSTLTFAIGIQFITGVVLWTAYSPNAQGAWESVYFIQNQMWGGWMLRGIHHYMAQATTVLLVLHLMQVVIDGAYRAPREVNFWFGLGLLGIMLGLSLTGYLLPWDQKGYWATKVATSIASITPVIGPSLQRLMVGGAEYGHHTLTRFFALHAGVLPASLIGLIAAHVYLFRRHGLTVKQPVKRADGMFWPDQLLRDAVACLAVMVAVLILVLRTGGAELGAPADPTEPYAAARPEWYFLFLFQWLKYFPAGWEVLGAIVVPGLVAGLVALMPLIGRSLKGHRFNLAVVSMLLLGVGFLTWRAVADDSADIEFARAKVQADESAHRVQELAGPLGIPATGALTLLRSDPLTQGPRLFAANCASCHRFDGHDGLGVVPEDEPSAADLHGFGSREWLSGLLDADRIDSPEYFGGTAFARSTRMVRFVKRVLPQWDAAQRQNLDKVVKALSAQANLPAQAAQDAADAAEIAEGLELLKTEEMRCLTCHTFEGQSFDEPTGPDLTGWGSEAWILGMLQNPAHERFYGDRNDGMPAFGDDEILTQVEMEMVAQWLRGEWYRTEAPVAATSHAVEDE
ncbi:MAG: cytochrome b N-terminal domain-containing protein [Gemmatimonadota bacterium]